MHPSQHEHLFDYILTQGNIYFNRCVQGNAVKRRTYAAKNDSQRRV
nr:MAG TPA: hypothetical protein [Caudoviricetes sp.]